MSTAAPVTLFAKVLLGLAAGACLIAMIGPFQGAEQALAMSDKAAHFAAFYGLTALLFLAFPQRRRFDLACLALLAGVGVELVQGASGRDADLSDLAANALGALAVLAPTYLERLRAAARPSTEPARPERRRTPLAALRARARSAPSPLLTDGRS